MVCVSEKAMAPHSSTLAWKIPWTEEPGRLQSMGSLRVRHNWATSLALFTFMHWRRKWQPTPVFLPGESQRRGSLVGCRLWGRTESDTTEATQQQQQRRGVCVWEFKWLQPYSPYWETCPSAPRVYKTVLQHLCSQQRRGGFPSQLTHGSSFLLNGFNSTNLESLVRDQGESPGCSFLGLLSRKIQPLR